MTPRSRELPKAKKLQMISVIKKYPVLWNKSLSTYRNIKEMRKAWNAASHELCLQVPVVKSKWKNLVDMHRREIFKQKYCNMPYSKWTFAEDMEFLSEQYHFKEHRIYETMRQQEEEENELDGESMLPEDIFEEIEDESQGDEEANEDPLKESPSDYDDYQPRAQRHSLRLEEPLKVEGSSLSSSVPRRLIQEGPPEEGMLQNELASSRKALRDRICGKLRDVQALTKELAAMDHDADNKEPEDEDMQFLKSLHSSLTAIPYPQRTICRTRMQQLLFKFMGKSVN